MSYKRLALVILISVVMIIFLLLTMRSCSIETKVEKSGTLGVVSTVKETEKSESIVISGEEGADLSEIDGLTVGTEGVEESSETELTGVSDEKSLVKVSGVKVARSYTVDGLVSEKSLYLLDDYIYTYCLKILIPVEGEYKGIDYMCSVSAWNAVETNESISVEYGLDSSGKIVILALSKV